MTACAAGVVYWSILACTLSEGRREGGREGREGGEGGRRRERGREGGTEGGKLRLIQYIHVQITISYHLGSDRA